MHLRLVFVVLLMALAAGLAAHPAAAQVPDTTRADALQTDTLRTDSLRTDSLRTAPARPDTVRADSLRPAANRPADGAQAGGPGRGTSSAGGGRSAVKFSSQDSLVIVFNDERGDVATLYGNAKATRGEVKLDAFAIEFLMARDELHAYGLPTDTGTVGLPHFQRGQGEAFVGQQLSFNLRTERGRVIGARTQMQQGFIEGAAVRYAGDSTVYIASGSYTTCDCPPGQTPSYSLRSTKMKVQGDWVYTGPIQLYIFNIPMPLWLPFAVLPAIQGRRSGPLPPRYGEDERGFYLKDWGWYWAINDYMDFQIRFGLWSRGSWSVNPRFRYTKRYRYSGSLTFDYINSVVGEPVDPNYRKSLSARLRWNHQQTINPTTNLSGNVNLATTNYLRFDSEDFDDNVTQEISSHVTFSKSWGQGARNLTLNLRHRQVITTGATYLTLPSLSFSQASFKPFERENRPPSEEPRWYERITVNGYNVTLQNSYTFDPLSAEELRARGDSAAMGISWYEALFSPSKYRRATGREVPFDFSASHRIPISAPFTINRLPLIGRFHVNVSPSLNYTEDWYFRTVRKTMALVEGEDGLRGVEQVERTVTGFFARREFNLGVSASTVFYGLFPINIGPFEGLRHTVRPRLSFSYQPNYNSDFWGYTRTFVNAEGRRVRYDIRTGQRVNRDIGQRTLSFGVSNTFETKRVRVDSTGERHSETIQLLDLDLSSGYNLALDSLRFSSISMSARTDLLEDVFNFSLRATFSPYVYNRRANRLVNRYVLAETGFWPVRLTRLSLTARTSFEGGGGAGGTRGGRFSGYDSGLSMSPNETFGGSSSYTDFSTPWSLNLDFSYRLTNRGDLEQTATLGASFNFNVTPKWKVDVRSGFDFNRMEVTYTQLNIARDFSCWQMTFNWTPFGRYQQYGFSLHVKSGKLANLLRLNLPRSNIKGRFRGLARQATGVR